jgi:hypothetical protein
MAWSRQQNKAIWRDPVMVAQTLVISNYGLIEEYVNEPPAPARGARLYILTPELHAEKYIVYIKFSDGVKTILFEYEP